MFATLRLLAAAVLAQILVNQTTQHQTDSDQSRLTIMQSLESVSGFAAPIGNDDSGVAGQKIMFHFFVREGCSLHFPDSYVADGLFDFPEHITVTDLQIVSDIKSLKEYDIDTGVQAGRNRIVIEGTLTADTISNEGTIASCEVFLDFEGRALGRFRRKFLITPLSPKQDWSTRSAQ